MRSRRPRSLSVIVLSLFASCSLLGGPTSEERGRAEDHLWRAQRFFIHKRYAQALQQTNRGLELAPSHYGLNQYKAKILLRGSRGNLGRLEAALAQFHVVLDLRSTSDIEYITYEGMGEAHMALYKLHKKKAAELTNESEREETKPDARERLTREAAMHRDKYRDHLAAAERRFRQLLAMGDGLLPANRFLFYLETDKVADVEGKPKDEQLNTAIDQGLAYLSIIEGRRDYYEIRYKAELRVEREADYDRRLVEYRKREAECRSLLHQLYFHSKQYEEAIAHLDRILELDPTNDAEYFNRAKCYENLGKKSEARRDYQDFLRHTKLPFESDRVRQARVSLTALGG